NDQVNQGQVIAKEGGTGGNYPIHLHFEIHEGQLWSFVDPLKHIPVPGDVGIYFDNAQSRLDVYGNYRVNKEVNSNSY
ncbi:MAG: hypothetical protein RBU37_27955, partial [Myxococcota bacterium]|nr:hypothetical protein [Myxococcota bacterium]